MFKHFLKSSWRNLIRNKSYGLINIAGLTIGLAAVILIALWIHDELSYNKYYKNYDRIGLILQQQNHDGIVSTNKSLPIPLSSVVRNVLGSDVEHVSLISNGDYNVNFKDKKLSGRGMFLEEGGEQMFSAQIIKGAKSSLKDPSSVLISQSFARSLFGQTDPVNQVIRITNQFNLKVAGVFKDFPKNVEFNDVDFIASWSFFQANWDWVKQQKDNWKYNLFGICVQLSAGTDMKTASGKIENILGKYLPSTGKHGNATKLTLFPMAKWHLYDQFDDRGQSIGGEIKYVELFGTIGLFILLLACINFMNLSTARSVKRAKEVGVRKAIGSDRKQLIGQFFLESIVATLLSFFLAIIIVAICLPFFNSLSDKQLRFPWTNLWFWVLGLGVCLFTGIIAGSYPAFYLSSFKPVKVLKGIFKAKKSANIPRKILVVFQFTVSIFLIIATVVIYKQIQYAKNRPVGYNQNGLLSIHMTTPEIYDHFDAIKHELITSQAITGMAESQCPVTQIWASEDGFEWKGKDPNTPSGFPVVAASIGFGEMLGWKFVAGRDYSADFATDSSGLVLSESAVKYMHLENPVGENLKWHGKNYKILGVVKDMMMDYPFGDTPPLIFPLLREPGNFIVLRLNPNKNLHDVIDKIKQTMERYNPYAPFTYSFVDDDYAANFNYVERIGKISTIFSVLALFISLLGLFGIASFTVEQKTKEVGIRKVLGASVPVIWKLLSKELMILVCIAVCLSIPIGYFAMNKWLVGYDYRIQISMWILACSASIAVIIALITISIQTVKAALINPVKSLKTE